MSNSYSEEISKQIYAAINLFYEQIAPYLNKEQQLFVHQLVSRTTEYGDYTIEAVSRLHRIISSYLPIIPQENRQQVTDSIKSANQSLMIIFNSTVGQHQTYTQTCISQRVVAISPYEASTSAIHPIPITQAQLMGPTMERAENQQQMLSTMSPYETYDLPHSNRLVSSDMPYDQNHMDPTMNGAENQQQMLSTMSPYETYDLPHSNRLVSSDMPYDQNHMDPTMNGAENQQMLTDSNDGTSTMRLSGVSQTTPMDLLQDGNKIDAEKLMLAESNAGTSTMRLSGVSQTTPMDLLQDGNKIDAEKLVGLRKIEALFNELKAQRQIHAENLQITEKTQNLRKILENKVSFYTNLIQQIKSVSNKLDETIGREMPNKDLEDLENEHVSIMGRVLVTFLTSRNIQVPAFQKIIPLEHIDEADYEFLLQENNQIVDIKKLEELCNKITNKV